MTNAQSFSRIDHLDILRGVALLGILLMNMQSFAMPGAAYFNPTAWGDFNGVNFAVWAFSHLFADAKFMTIFSLLFGAGICLFSERAEQKHGSATALHYKRNGWLLLFGLIHGYFIWYGDILYSYALCAFWLFWLRAKSVKLLTVLALICLSVASLYSLLGQYAMNNGLLGANDLESLRSMWAPTAVEVQAEISAYRGSVVEQFWQRIGETLFLQTEAFYSYLLWRASGMMLLGMALYKSGILTGQKSQRYYLTMGVVGLLGGLTLSSYGLQQHLQNGFSMQYSLLLGAQYNYWGSCLTALSYVGWVYFAINGGIAKAMQQRLAAVGQMAFTNYITQSLLATLVFYGHGLGLYGQIERSGQLLLVVLIWALQLWYSPLWLKYYRFGPLEWLWRSLTYWKKQPLRRQLKPVFPK